MRKLSIYALVSLMMVFLINCSKDEDGKTTINVFSIQDDIDLGKQLADEIASDPVTYPVLNEFDYPDSYTYMNALVNKLLNTGEIAHKDDFAWDVKIIYDDSTLNAFCAPGGYIYVYTGLIKYLEYESEFAGVLGHEIAHADLRHSTDAMTKQYGIAMLLSVVTGKDETLLGDIAAGLIGLSYSRKNETQADEASVRYLCATDWEPTGTAGFFQKLIDNGQAGGTPAFLSTHPSPENRVQNIVDHSTSLGCADGSQGVSSYQAFQSSLP